MGRKFSFSWSWKRVTGLSSFRGKVSRRMGIPLTRSGRQRKVGRAAGCCVVLLIGVSVLALGLALYGCTAPEDRGKETSLPKLETETQHAQPSPLPHPQRPVVPTRSEPPESAKKATDALAYLSEFEEIAWAEILPDEAYIGFRSAPGDGMSYADMCAGAARKASKEMDGAAYMVWGVDGTKYQRGWRPSKSASCLAWACARNGRVADRSDGQATK